MGKPAPGTTPQEQAGTFGVAGIRRHILLCAGPDCTETARGETAWNYLKKRIAELKLEREPTGVFRTRCHCLRICTGGPIAVVHPDNTWYHSADPAVLERILREHVLGGEVVEEFVLASEPLAGG